MMEHALLPERSVPRVSLAPGADLDPALVAFLKCHVTSPLKWEVLRLLVEREGRWMGAEDVAQIMHRPRVDVERAVAELSREGVLEELRSGNPDDTSYRLPRLEPTTVVLERLMHGATRSQTLRSVIAAHLRHAQMGMVDGSTRRHLAA